MISTFDMFKIGVGPSSSHTVGPMNAGKSFIDELQKSGALSQITGLTVDLYGSLSLTGKGHATDVAVIMGLAGNRPDNVDIDAIPAFIRAVQRSGRLPVAQGAAVVPFSVNDDVVFHDETLPRHENGMRFTARHGDQILLSKTYYSVGGGFIVEEKNLARRMTSNSPYRFRSALPVNW
jgi:L-serine ammonia-lyase (EC 4.3.1.17)